MLTQAGRYESISEAVGQLLVC